MSSCAKVAAVKFYMDMIAAAERGDALSALWFYWWCLHVTECAQEYDTSMRRLSRFYFVRPDLLFPSDAPAAR
jgi:predicted alpha-1,6-mannanase (GH76 family)